MAKHDRIRVRLLDGQLLELVAVRVGGRVESGDDGTDVVGVRTFPDDPIMHIRELTRNGSIVRELRVRRDHVTAVIVDRAGDETMPHDKPRSRRR